MGIASGSYGNSSTVSPRISYFRSLLVPASRRFYASYVKMSEVL
jgi:hypothetical protein